MRHILTLFFYMLSLIYIEMVDARLPAHSVTFSLQPGAAQHSHSRLLLTTEQSYKGKWGLSAYIKCSSMVVV